MIAKIDALDPPDVPDAHGVLDAAALALQGIRSAHVARRTAAAAVTEKGAAAQFAKIESDFGRDLTQAAMAFDDAYLGNAAPHAAFQADPLCATVQ